MQKQTNGTAVKPVPKTARWSAPRTSGKAVPVKIIPLGGTDEIGKNITLYECGEDIIVVDCGMGFPEADMFGVDIVLPDMSYLFRNKDRIRGLIITHGHEDHIGSVPYLLKEADIPIYATRLTVGLIEGKLREHNLLDIAKLNVVYPGDNLSLGCFNVELIHVNHSIPDAVALAIRCPAGLIVQTGDFKIDPTPIDDRMIDLARFAQLGKEGVLALLSDSTNAERGGFSPSERTVGSSFATLFGQAEKSRIIVASFSSNIHRIQQIVDEAVKRGRKVCFQGRSMLNVVTVGCQLGHLKIPDGTLIDIDMIKRYRPEQLVIITTGSQGEPMSALHRMAFSDHRKIEVGPGDLIIISATPIPGNEKLVSRVVNELMKLGADVVYEKMYDVHVSGHACQEELKIILGLISPKFFIPVHGEHRHLRKHAALAASMGIPLRNILIPEIGRVIELTPTSMKTGGVVPSGYVLVDGLGIGDVGSVVLRDRKHLSEDGIIVAAITLDSASGTLMAGPDIVSRGFVYVKESEKLLEDARRVALAAVEAVQDAGAGQDWAAIRLRIRDDLSRFLYERTKRSPMILPIIMEV